MVNLADTLNSAIKSDSQNGTFHGGQGIVLRNLDDHLVNKHECKVVPGSFWHNDIWPPNQIYPAGTAIMEGGNNGTNWVTPTLVVAIAGTELFGRLFSTSNLHDDTWIDGVWYAHDSNSCDNRALYVPNSDGYDAPYAWIHRKSEQVDYPLPDKRGSGHYGPGNPTLPKPLGGGGTGVHVRYNYEEAPGKGKQYVDQIDGTTIGLKLFKDDHACQIDYHKWNPKTVGRNCDIVEAVRGWKSWIEAFTKDAEKRGTPREAWVADLAMGWLNNPRPMITLQNALWKYRENWCNGTTQPHNPNSDERYWGWNEIPFAKDTINKPENWTCYVIVLPPGIKSLREALTNSTAQANLIEQLNTYKENYYLHGHGQSSVVLARQIKNPKQPDPHVTVWMREFFAENVTIGGGWSIKDGKVFLN